MCISHSFIQWMRFIHSFSGWQTKYDILVQVWIFLIVLRKPTTEHKSWALSKNCVLTLYLEHASVSEICVPCDKNQHIVFWDRFICYLFYNCYKNFCHCTCCARYYKLLWVTYQINILAIILFTQKCGKFTPKFHNRCFIHFRIDFRPN